MSRVSLNSVSRFVTFCNLSLVALLSFAGCIHIPTPEEQMRHIEQATGLRPDADGASSDPALTKVHHGYPVMVRFKMGNVWGRWATRVAVGEIGDEVGGILGFLTGQTRSGVGGITGSPFDRVLSQTIGQPLSVVVVLRHGKPGASRLDVYNQSSTIYPYDPLPSVEWVSMSAGTLYSADSSFARRILNNGPLMSILENFRSGYVRVDEYAVSFLFAGSENEYSGMLRNFGSYENMLNKILDGLAGIADEI
jgi:hypothetical protein